MIDNVGEFVTLVWQACHDPDSTDRAALLRAASDYLDGTFAGTGDLLLSSRKMAFAACDWAMFWGSHDKLRQAQQLFELHSRLHYGLNRLARLHD